MTKGREPALESLELENGETVRGWLTYRVPADGAYRPDGFLWRPDPRVNFSFLLPLHTSSLVCGYSRVFGRVTDPLGSPVSRCFGGAFLLQPGSGRKRLRRRSVQGRGHNARFHEHGRDWPLRALGGYRFCTERCVELTAFPPAGSDLQAVTVTDGTIVPSAENGIAEKPELRIDATLAP